MTVHRIFPTQGLNPGLPHCGQTLYHLSHREALDQEEPLEKEMATHSSNLAWEIPWTEEPGELQSMGSQKSPISLSD